MRKRTIALLAVGTLFAALVGGVAGVVLIAFANPGVKGPHVSDEELLGALLGGAFVGGGLVVGGRILWGRSRRRKKWELPEGEESG